MRSTSALVKPATAAITITAASATAAGSRRRAATSQPPAIAGPIITAQATGEPIHQNA